MPELLRGWGRTAPSRSEVIEPAGLVDVIAAIRTADRRGVLARGLARSYGDAAQNAGGRVLRMRDSTPLQTPDPVTGQITCPAGASVDELLRHIVPLGWFIPVTPGTRQVSLGGAVAADVHGKNHHRDGSFAGHVTRLQVVDGMGVVRDLTPSDDAFWAVAGGMGLTGVITEVTMRLSPITSSYMNVRARRTSDLEQTMAALVDADTHTYSVAWIDCLSRGASSGRGIVTSAEHCSADELSGRAGVHPLRFTPSTRLGAPPWVPSGLLNRHTVAAFNHAYYMSASDRPKLTQHHSGSYFHPLDAVNGWNRLYGTRGLVQYQFVCADTEVVRWVVGTLARTRLASFLAVLKRFGPPNRGPLSFPQAGWTLAVDLPADQPDLAASLDSFDERVAAAGGRVYLAKDSRLRPQLLQTMYPQLERWRELRAELDPAGVFVSDLSRRLSL